MVSGTRCRAIILAAARAPDSLSFQIRVLELPI